MKVVAVLGSPHGMTGNTGRLLEPLLDAVRQRGAETQVFSLAELEVGPCRGCDVCHRTGSCHIKDDGDTIKAAMAGADGVVLASPNYVFSVSAQMKALFDRCCGAIHCRGLSGTYGAAVVTAGGGGSEGVISYIGQFLLATAAWMVGGVAAEGAHLVEARPRRSSTPRACEPLGEGRRKASPGQGRKELASLGGRIHGVWSPGAGGHPARELGERLVDAIEARATFPDQEAQLRAFADRMRELVAARKDQWPYEYNYWKQRGWLDT
jgi:multimeric flavodoxin WrbA